MLAHRQYIFGAVQRITSTNHDASLAAVTTHGVESSKKARLQIPELDAKGINDLK